MSMTVANCLVRIFRDPTYHGSHLVLPLLLLLSGTDAHSVFEDKSGVALRPPERSCDQSCTHSRPPKAINYTGDDLSVHCIVLSCSVQSGPAWPAPIMINTQLQVLSVQSDEHVEA